MFFFSPEPAFRPDFPDAGKSVDNFLIEFKYLHQFFKEDRSSVLYGAYDLLPLDCFPGPESELSVLPGVCDLTVHFPLKKDINPY